MTKYPSDVLSVHCREYGSAAAISDLRAAGYIIVRHDAIKLAQEDAEREAESWRDIAFKRGALLDEVGIKIWERAAKRLADDDDVARRTHKAGRLVAGQQAVTTGGRV